MAKREGERGKLYRICGLKQLHTGTHIIVLFHLPLEQVVGDGRKLFISLILCRLYAWIKMLPLSVLRFKEGNLEWNLRGVMIK